MARLAGVNPLLRVLSQQLCRRTSERRCGQLGVGRGVGTPSVVDIVHWNPVTVVRIRVAHFGVMV